MWPFGKKKNKEQTPDPTHEQVQAFAAGFEADEFTLVAVTGSSGLDFRKEEGDALYTILVPLTAWMDEEDGVVHRESAVLTALADDRLRDYLRARLFPDSMVKVQARPGKQSGTFQLVGMPEPGLDPELKAILNEQTAPVTFDGEGLGLFTLNRRANWFQTDLTVQDRAVQLSFDASEDRESCLGTARTLVADLRDWDTRARALVADRLTGQVNEQLEPEDQVTGEVFSDGLELESVQVSANGEVVLWYGSDLVWGEGVRVMGSADRGPADAVLEQ